MWKLGLEKGEGIFVNIGGFGCREWWRSVLKLVQPSQGKTSQWGVQSLFIS